MKILLVRPASPNALSFTGVLDSEPLELEYLHTVLEKNGYEDYIFDTTVEYEPFFKVLKRENPDIVAITGYISQENIMLKFAKQAKEHNPRIQTIIGGCHAQLNYQRFYNVAVDFIARSECMEAFIQLIKYIEGLDTTINITSINGICHKKSNEYIVNDLTPSDINLLPIPDRTHFYKYKEKYRYLDLPEMATVKTSFSCPFNCNFCYCTLLSCGKYSVRNLDLVIEEIEQLDVQNVQISDDDFLVSRERVIQFINMIVARNIKKTFICYARADFIAQNPDVIKMLVDIGFKYFLVGLEAVNNKTLDSFNKQTTDSINRKCIEVIHATTAHCIGLFIVNIDATKKEFRELYNWVVSTGIKYVTVSMFTPIPGTKLYEDNKHLIISDNIEDWDFLHLVINPTNLSKKQFYREYYKLFLKLYKIAAKTGIYDFMNIKFYKKLLGRYFLRKMRGL